MLLRSIISILLLCIYSLSIVHGAIPHCHGHENGIAHADHSFKHDHHASVTALPSCEDASEHIEHKGHLDENVIDLLLCLFNETDHPENLGEDEFIAAPIFSSCIAVTTVPVVDLLSSLHIAPQSVLTFLSKPYIASIILSPTLAPTAERGPPVIS